MLRNESPMLDLPAEHLQALRQLLTQHVPQATVWAFGSRVTGHAHEGSDLDLVLRQDDDLTRPVSGLLALQDVLQQSALPMLVEVHDWAYLPQVFRAGIEHRHLRLQVGGRRATAVVGPR